tara:strand:+ start:1069 stop:1431 length:363 start_codon:yes stop_codon:yes gene_type:complete
MKLKEYKIEELKPLVLELIARTNFELGFKTSAETLAGLSTILAEDLITARTFFNLEFSDIQKSFHLGIRNGKDNFMNIPTFWKWIKEHKQRIADDIYSAETLGVKETELLYYKPKQKLLK